ncbi:hypothetical protein RhiirB3_460140 [Rhizophagus irregularis]|nr:hypothetical protein RhiirB3_460140 [Rhizophagus irregularis]
MLKVIKDVSKDKFIAIVSDAETAMQLAKRRVINKHPHIMTVRFALHNEINLFSKDNLKLSVKIR